MKTIQAITVVSLFLLPASASHSFTTASADQKEDIWISAYFASWQHFEPPEGHWGVLPADEIDFDAFTHLIYFAVTADTNGTLRDDPNIFPARLESIVRASHHNDTPVLISVGGWGNYEGFSNSIQPRNRNQFAKSLITFMETWGFDGIDLDMEPIQDHDVKNYKAFVKLLSEKLNNLQTPMADRPYLTAALMGSHPEMFVELQDYFDQINLMTYDHSGAWDGWVAWHNSNIYNGGFTFPQSPRPMPSAHETIQIFLDAGIDASKLGMGLDFYGYVWKGVHEPLQGWGDVWPAVEDNIPYFELAQRYEIHSLEEPNSYYFWDEDAAAAYLSINDPTRFNQPKFVSYDNERTAIEKIQYIRNNGLGGMIIWELAGGYQYDLPPGQRDRLLQSVKQEFLGDEEVSPEPKRPIYPPAILHPEPNTVDIPVELEIQWEHVADTSFYEVNIAKNEMFNPLVIDTTVANPKLSLSDLKEQQSYYFRVRTVITDDKSEWSELRKFTTQTITSSGSEPDQPYRFELHQNYPNPFNPVTTLSYTLPATSPVILEIYSAVGHRVALLVDEIQQPGRYEFSFDGVHLASGIYFYRLQTQYGTLSKKMSLIK